MEAIGRKVIYTFPGSIPERGGASRTVRHVELDVDDPPRLPGSPLIERAAPELWLGPRVLKGGGHIKVVWTLRRRFGDRADPQLPDRPRPLHQRGGRGAGGAACS